MQLVVHKGGAKRVVISAPSGDADVMICLGVNDGAYDPKAHTVISNASCTDQLPGADGAGACHERFGIDQGFINTVHAYTSDQQLQTKPSRPDRGSPTSGACAPRPCRSSPTPTARLARSAR
jgi:glyceraldehyde 3-phosphate dehydrogenase